MNVPEFCINKFRTNFKLEPSIIEVQLESYDKLEKMTKKSETLWFKSVFREKGMFFLEKLVEYDAYGVYIYILRDEESPKVDVVFLTTMDRKNVVEYSLHNLFK